MTWKEPDRARVVLVGGESGVGKSALIEAVVRAGALRCFTGRPLRGCSTPFKPWADILRDWRDQAGPALDRARAHLPRLRSLFPEAGFEAEPRGGTAALFESVLAVLEVMGRDVPAVLVFEDLQASDAASLELFEWAADRLRRCRLALIGVYRSDALPGGHPVRRWRAALRRIRPCLELDLGPLDPGASLVLVERILGGPAHLPLAQEIHTRAQGLPLFIEELCGALRAADCLEREERGWRLTAGRRFPLPDRIRDAFLQPLEELSPAGRALLELAAVAGREFELPVMGELEHSAAWDELIERGWIVELGDGRGDFRRVLAREAVLSEMTWSRRRAAHERLATHLEKNQALPEVIAPHYAAAGDRLRARQAWLAAADRFCRMQAPEDAFRAFHEALAPWPPGQDETARLETLRRAAGCAQTCGRFDDAIGWWRAILDRLDLHADGQPPTPPSPNQPQRGLPAPPTRGEAQRALAALHALRGDHPQALAAHQAAARHFESAGSPAEAAREWTVCADLAFLAARLTEARAAAEAAVEQARTTGLPELESRALNALAVVTAATGQASEARQLIQHSLALALPNNLTEAAADAYRRLATLHEYASDYQGEVEAFSEAVQFCRARGRPTEEQLCLGCMTYALFRAGEWKPSLNLCRRILRHRSPPDWSVHMALNTQALIHLHRGELKQARRLLPRVAAYVRRQGLVVLELFLLWEHGLLAELEDREADAARHYRELIHLWRRTEDRHDALQGIGAASTFFADRRQTAETLACAEIAGRMAADTGNPEAAATLAHTLGEAALAQERPEDAAPHLIQAADQHKRAELLLDALKSSLRAAQALRHTEHPDAADPHLRWASNVARRLGARPLHARLENLLQADPGNGTVARPPTESAVALLTRRQREIVRLIARGHINKEIAAQLGISVRTVDMHVRHLLERLACRTRAEAIRKLADALPE